MKTMALCMIFYVVFISLSPAEMIDGSASIYDAAHGEKIGVLYDGTKIDVNAKQGSWYKISVSFSNRREINQKLKQGTKGNVFLYDKLLGRIGSIKKGVALQTVLSQGSVTIKVFVKKKSVKDTVKYYLEGTRKLTSPRSVYFSFTKEVSEAKIKNIIAGANDIDPMNYDQDVLFIEVGYTDNKPTTVLCYSLIDGWFGIKERYHCNKDGMPVKYVTGYDPVETHVFAYYENYAYKEFYWEQNPQTSIYSQNGYINYVLYTDEYEYEIHIRLAVAENEDDDPGFYVLAETAAIYKIDRIAGQTVQKQELDSYTQTEVTLQNLKTTALFKNDILSIQSGIDFDEEFKQIIEELLIYYK
jgi:hypothetical protein